METKNGEEKQMNFGNKLQVIELIFSVSYWKNTIKKPYFSSWDQEKGSEDKDRNLQK